MSKTASFETGAEGRATPAVVALPAAGGLFKAVSSVGFRVSTARVSHVGAGCALDDM